jgi:hypothetical protein
MGQVANCKYVCDKISEYTNRTYTPFIGTEYQVANISYLMKCIDRATRDNTGGGQKFLITKQHIHLYM